MNKKTLSNKQQVLSAVELADAEDAVAERYEEMGVGEDDTEFLHADAAERRRLDAINRELELAEAEELRKWKNSIRRKSAKRLDAPVG